MRRKGIYCTLHMDQMDRFYFELVFLPKVGLIIYPKKFGLIICVSLSETLIFKLSLTYA
jgi:hypothetical protein